MATYEEIYGKRVEVLDADPTLTSANEGQVWYNSTSGTLKSVVSFASWSSQTSLGTNKYGSGFGQTVDASGMAGIQGPPGGSITTTEEFNGVGWTTGGSYSDSAYRRAAAGTQTSAFLAGGYAAPTIRTYTENYNGSSWTSGGTIPQPSQFGSAQGPQTAGFYGGAGPDAVEWYDYDGSSYSSAANATSDLQQRALFGNAAAQTAAIASGGYSPPGGSTNSEEWNGTAFSNTPSTNIANWARGTGGTSTNAVVFGSSPNSPTPNSSQTATETWDGTSYATSPATLGSGRSAIQGGAGIATNALMMGGSTGPAVDALTNAVEEYNLSINTFTAAAWASGNAMNTPRYACFGVGSQTAALGATGYTGPPYVPTVNSEEYNGTSWTEGDNVNTGRYGAGGCGTQTAAVAVGGDSRPPGSQYVNNAEEYDGSSWTNVTAYPVVITFAAGAGTQTTGVVFSGGVPGGPRTAQTSEYDGSSWTTSSPQNMNTARSAMGSGGTQTAAIGFAGDTGPGLSGLTETYNGSTWTAGGAMTVTGVRNVCGGGPETGSTSDVLAIGGPPSNPKATMIFTEGYDGTAWSTRNSLGTGRNYLSGGGTSSTAIAFGGDSTSPGPGYTGATEEYTGVTETVTAKTLTTS